MPPTARYPRPMPTDPASESRAEHASRDSVRRDTVRVEYPRVLLWSGGLIALLTCLTYLEEPEAPLLLHAIDAAAAVTLVGLGWLLLTVRLPSRLLPWLFATAVTGVVLALSYQVHVDEKAIGFAYIAVVLTAFGPTTLYWLPFLAGSAVSMVAITVVATQWSAAHPTEWQILALGATLIGTVLLRTRLRSIDALADATALAERLAVTDELTGLLNRHGLNAQLPRLTAMGTRLDTPLFAVFIDIDGLKRANDRHGHAFGDEVIQMSGQAVLACVRGGDLVARWGGDELVVVGLGQHPEPTAYARRLDHQVSASGIDRERWPGHLSVGFAQGDAPDTSIDALIEQADADMYRRRGR